MEEKTFKLPSSESDTLKAGFPLSSVLFSDPTFNEWLEEMGTIRLFDMVGSVLKEDNNEYLFITITYTKQ